MIQRLPREIVEKIAAGEVITSVVTMAKELIENSLDANSSEIEVRMSTDYSKLEIIDNGDGIDERDFDMLCERHCTSKLSKLSDLSAITHYGFRGEALASISLCAKVTVRSNKVQGLEAKYVEGKLVSVKKTGMSKGSQFTVTDLFYNNKMRRDCLVRNKDEIRNMLNMISLYAVFNSGVRFAVYLDNEAQEKFRYKAPGTVGKEQSLESKKEMLKYFYNIKNELVHSMLGNVGAIFSQLTLHLKKPVFILFVNKRLVECRNLKSELMKIYSNIIPRQRYPFIYIELGMDPREIDVNVHPSKKEVLFSETKAIVDIRKMITSMLETQETLSIPLVKSTQESTESVAAAMSQKQPQSSPVDIKVYSSSRDAKLDNLKSYDITKEYRLLSIKTLCGEIKEVDNQFFRSLVYVGKMESRAFVQYGMHLLMCNLHELKNIFFYQNFILEFGNFDRADAKRSAEKGGEADPDFVAAILALSDATKNFLNDYFCIKVCNGRILTLPTKFDIEIDFQAWQKFIMLVSTLTLDDEIDVFRTVIKHLASLFANAGDDEKVFSIMKRKMLGTAHALKNFSVVTTLKELYKQFERC